MRSIATVSGRRAARRRGTARSWTIVATAAAITAGLVVVFIRSLPPPPRFDDLRVEPGSSTPVMRGIIRRLYSAEGGSGEAAAGAESAAPVTSSVNDVAIDAWPNAADGEPASLVVHRIPIERAEATFAIIGVEGVDVSVVVRRGRSVVLRAGDDTPIGERFEIESNSIILPDGVSDLEVEMRPRSEAASAGLWWREVEGGTGTAAVGSDPRRRPLAELLDETASEG